VASRNLLLCLLISSLCSSWLLVQITFMPRYLIEVDGMQPARAGFLISVIGISGVVGGVLVPALSDRFGRRPALILAAFGGVVAPLVILTVPEPAPVLAFGLFVGWLAGSAGPLYLAIMPTESVPADLRATAVAVTLGAGELVGGIFAPALVGAAADAHGLRVPFLVSIWLAVASGVVALFLHETAPLRPGRSLLAPVRVPTNVR
jgi:MFS family permease